MERECAHCAHTPNTPSSAPAPAVVAKARVVQDAWDEFDLEVRCCAWRSAVSRRRLPIVAVPTCVFVVPSPGATRRATRRDGRRHARSSSGCGASRRRAAPPWLFGRAGRRMLSTSSTSCTAGCWICRTQGPCWTTSQAYRPSCWVRWGWGTRGGGAQEALARCAICIRLHARAPGHAYHHHAHARLTRRQTSHAEVALWYSDGAELEDANRKLQSVAEHAARDDAEIHVLVDKHQKLEAAYKDLQVRKGPSGGGGTGIIGGGGAGPKRPRMLACTPPAGRACMQSTCTSTWASWLCVFVLLLQEEVHRRDQDISAMAASAQETMRAGHQLAEQSAELRRLQVGAPRAVTGPWKGWDPS